MKLGVSLVSGYLLFGFVCMCVSGWFPGGFRLLVLFAITLTWISLCLAMLLVCDCFAGLLCCTLVMVCSLALVVLGLL